MEMRKRAARFNRALRKIPYLFHIHTDWTDGESSLYDYCVVSEKLGFQSIIVTEHVRRNPSYNFADFWDVIESQRSSCDLEIVGGVEAKILPGGRVDVSESVLDKIEVLAIAEHSFKGNASELAMSLANAFKFFKDTEFACVWVHPGLRLLKMSASDSLFNDTLRVAIECGVYIEFNLRYRLPPDLFLSLIPASNLLIGIDAHSVEHISASIEDLLYYENTLKESGGLS